MTIIRTVREIICEAWQRGVDRERRRQLRKMVLRYPHLHAAFSVKQH